jgi:outer membrane protein assembly factor BamD (BamD/ComL family)
MTRAAIFAAVGVTTITACATLRPSKPSDNDLRFNNGVKALNSGDFATAESTLNTIVQAGTTEQLNQRALLVLAAAQMDPRNPNRKIESGAQLAARFLLLPERDLWVDPIAQTLYLLGLELSQAEQRADRAEQQAEQAQAKQRELPKLTGPTVSARIKAVEQERDRLAKRVSSLEEQLAQSQRELERIKKTIKN